MTDAPSLDDRGSLGQRLLRVGAPSKLGAVYMLLLLIAIFSLWIPDLFFSVQTARLIIEGQSVAALLALGLLFPLAGGVFDLSIGYMLGLAAIITAVMLRDGHPIPLVIACAVAATLVVALVNSFMVVVVGVDSFIATLGVSSILQAVVLAIPDNRQVIGLPDGFTDLVRARPLGVPIVAIYLAVAALLAWYLLEHTVFGRQLHAVGQGREAARLAGLRVGRYVCISFCCAAVGAALAGIALTGIVGSGDPNTGPQYLLPAFAACFLGATQFQPGRMNVPGMLVSIFLLGTGSTGLQLGGAPFWVIYVFNGAALLIAVGLAQGVARLRLRRTRAARPGIEPAAASTGG